MTTSTADQGLGGGDHVCLVHDSHLERTRVLEGRVVDAFRAGARVLILAESTTDQHLTDLLGRMGQGLRDGQLEVRSARDSYLPGGTFACKPMLAALEDEKRAALADGFTGVCFLADMSWAATDPDGGVGLAEYERAAGAVFADGRASAVCSYDAQRFGADALASYAAAHPLLASAFDGVETLKDRHVAIDVGRHGTVRPRGQVDMSNAALLERALATAAERSDDVCVDASELTFIDVRGLRALLDTARSTRVALLAPPSSLRGMIDALDVRRALPGLHVG